MEDTTEADHGAVVRDARHGEGSAIARCKLRSWQAAYRGLLPDTFLDELALEPAPEAYEQGVAAGRPVLVAATAQDVVGVAAVGPARGDDLPSRHGELFMLYVDPAHWATGVGHRLHEAALERLRSYGFVRAVLWVLDGNERAIGFYERHGWAPDGATQVERHGEVVLVEHRYRRDL